VAVAASEVSYPVSVSDIPLSRRSSLSSRTSLAWDSRTAAATIGVSVAAAAAVAAPAAARGAYFPTAWGWVALACGWVAFLALLIRGLPHLGRLEWATLGGLVSLTIWIALSALWSTDVSQTALEVERALVYVTGALVAMLLVSRRTVPQFLAGILGGITAICVYSLTTRLFPERFGSYDEFAVNRLQEPLGYWNALGTFAAMGLLLAIGFTARARPLWGRGLAGVAVPLLVTTLYFAFGRGAWISLGIGLLAALAFDNRRLQLITTVLVVAPFAGTAVWLCSRSDAMTSPNPLLSEAAADGRALAPVLLAIAAACGVAAVLFGSVDRRLPSLPRARLVYAAVLLWFALAGVSSIVTLYGSPWAIAERGYHEFVDAQPPTRLSPEERSDLNRRLFTLWGNGRAELWSVGWDVAREHALLGSGAGTYEQHWIRDRPIENDARDAHSLYLETLAELGPAGLFLLALVLGTPLIAAFRSRRNRLVGAVTGAYVVYLVHAGADWDWEMTAVTLTAIFCGVGLLVAARDEEAARWGGGLLRAAAATVAIAAVTLSFVGLLGNQALAQSERASGREDWTDAEGEARNAIRWTPWSAHGWQALGEAQLLQLKLPEARESFRKALEKDPDDWNLWLNLAYASKGAEQRRAAERALALNPLSSEIERVRPAIGLPPAGG
jgi:O-Antigen ligase